MIVEEAVNRLEAEVRHPDEIGVRKNQRHAKAVGVRLAHVADLSGKDVLCELSLLLGFHVGPRGSSSCACAAGARGTPGSLYCISPAFRRCFLCLLRPWSIPCLLRPGSIPCLLRPIPRYAGGTPAPRGPDSGRIRPATMAGPAECRPGRSGQPPRLSVWRVAPRVMGDARSWLAAAPWPGRARWSAPDTSRRSCPRASASAPPRVSSDRFSRDRIRWRSP